MLSVCDIASGGTLVIGLIHMIFWNVRRSRCTDIKCFCIKCKRELMTGEELADDKLNNTV